MTTPTTQLTIQSEIESFIDDPIQYANMQMDYFISSKSGKTPYGTYKQACLEMRTRYYALADELYEIKKLKKDIGETEEPMERFTKELRVRNLQREVKRKERELIRFMQQATFINNKYGFKGMTPEEKEPFEVEMWRAKAIEELVTDIGASGAVSKSTIKHINNTHPRVREELLPVVINADKQARVEAINRVMLEYMNTPNFQFPVELPAVEYKEAKLEHYIKEIEDGTNET